VDDAGRDYRRYEKYGDAEDGKKLFFQAKAAEKAAHALFPGLFQAWRFFSGEKFFHNLSSSLRPES